MHLHITDCSNKIILGLKPTVCLSKCLVACANRDCNGSYLCTHKWSNVLLIWKFWIMIICKHLLQALKIILFTVILLQYRIRICCTYLMMRYVHIYILFFPIYLILLEGGLFKLKYTRGCMLCIQLERNE